MTWKKILLLIIVVVLIIKNMIITDIDDWDNGTSLDLKVYIKPEENTMMLNQLRRTEDLRLVNV